MVMSKMHERPIDPANGRVIARGGENTRKDVAQETTQKVGIQQWYQERKVCE